MSHAAGLSPWDRLSGSRRRGWALGGALVAALAVVAGPAGAGVAGAAGVSRLTDSAPYYLSLGDSLARGVQPNGAGRNVPSNQGYADDLWATYHSSSPHLRLAKLGCPGETTGTMMNGGICSYPLGSQLAQAADFLANHRVRFVTIDIGANNIDNCVSAAGIDQACLAASFATVRNDLPVILQALRQAAPTVVMVGMNYYDPFVAAALKGGAFLALAVQSEQLGATFNKILENDFASSGVRLADVQAAFAPVTVAALPYLDLPIDLALACAYTWMCAPAPVGPNIHATALGYTVIAAAFAQKIG